MSKNIFGKLFSKGKQTSSFNIVDAMICIVIALLIIGAIMVKNGFHKPLSNISMGVKPVEFTIVTRAYDVTARDELFKAKDKTFITIRNVPYTELEIVAVKKERPKEMFFNYDRPDMPYLMENGAYPNRFQYEITLKDNAQITQDGAVIGGNKIKIGLPVDLEGFNYRLSGTVSDITVLEEEQEER